MIMVMIRSRWDPDRYPQHAVLKTGCVEGRSWADLGPWIASAKVFEQEE